MTEAEWLACADSEAMSGVARDKASERKLRLFLVACNGLTGRFGGYEDNPEAIGIAERYADALASEEELRGYGVSWMAHGIPTTPPSALRPRRRLAGGSAALSA